MVDDSNSLHRYRMAWNAVREEKGGFSMKFDAEMLRNDLKIYAETALRVGLPCTVQDVTEIENASEAELVDIAATSGWDLGKYVSGFPSEAGRLT